MMVHLLKYMKPPSGEWLLSMTNNFLERALVPVGFSLYLVVLITLSWPSNFAFTSSCPNQELIPRFFEMPLLMISCATYLTWTAIAWLRPVSRKLVFPIAIASIAILGAVFFYLALYKELDAAPLFALSSVLLGLGLPSGIMVWVRILATQDFYYSSTRIVLSLTIAAIILFLLIAIDYQWSWPIIFIFTCVSFLSMPICINMHNFDEEAFTQRPCDYKERYKSQVSNLWRPLIFALATALTWGLMRYYDFSFMSEKTSDICLCAGMFLSALTLVFLWTVFNNKYGFVRVFKLLTPVFLLAFLCLLFFKESSMFLSILSSYAFVLAWLLVLLICARDAQNKAVHPYVFWGIFTGTYAFVANIMGFVLGGIIVPPISAATSIPASAIVAIIGILVFFVVLYIDDMFITKGNATMASAIAQNEEKKENHGTRDEVNLSSKLQAIAERYELTPREKEVFGYLARGRDVYHISEELFVSISTVQFHTKNIYKKLDVHSKQDLITIVEEYEC